MPKKNWGTMNQSQRELVEKYINAAYKRAWSNYSWYRSRLKRLTLDADDFIAVADEALCKASMTYRADSGIKFVTYLYNSIDIAIKMEIMRKNSIVKVPEFAYVKDEGMRKKVYDMISGDSEVASFCKVVGKSKDGGDIELQDTLGDEEAGYEDIEIRLTVDQMVSKVLNKEQKAIVEGLFYDELKQGALAKKLGIDQTNISRRRTYILKLLREYCDKNGIVA
jgi:RNA polymerase sigma factor (sigma-70 family)